MSDNPFSRLLDSTQRHLRRLGARPVPDAGRRSFFRRAAGLGAAGAIGTGLMIPDDAWAGIEERAARFGITPGTAVDAQGRLLPEGEGQDAYIGEIMLFCGNFVVRNYAACDGALIAISANTALFSIIGTSYGGNGQSTFGLPNLQGRTPIGFGNGPGLQAHLLGQFGGRDQITLTESNLASHDHTLPVLNDAGTLRRPNGSILAGDDSSDMKYAPASAANGNLAPSNPTGGSQPYASRRPSLALNFQICTAGIYPSRS